VRTLIGGGSYPAAYKGTMIRAVKITTDVTSHFFATDALTFQGNKYEARLKQESVVPIKRFRSLQTDAAMILLSNENGAIEDLIAVEKFEGAEAVLMDLLRDLDPLDGFELLRGVLTDRIMRFGSIEWDIIPTWDAAGTEAPIRDYMRTCSFRFKKPECGYVDGVDPDDPGTGLPFVVCPKDLTACTARGREHSYPGFIHVTRELSAAFPPPASVSGPSAEGERAGFIDRISRFMPT